MRTRCSSAPRRRFRLGQPSGVFRCGSSTFEGGGAIEILEPMGEDRFLHRFLDERGPGFHHVTFGADLDEGTRSRRRAGYDVVGRDGRGTPEVEEALLQPGGRSASSCSSPSPRRRSTRPPPQSLGPCSPIRRHHDLVSATLHARSSERALAWENVLERHPAGPRGRAGLPLARLPDAPRGRDRSRATRVPWPSSSRAAQRSPALWPAPGAQQVLRGIEYLPREGDGDLARAGRSGECGRARLRRVGGIVAGLERARRRARRCPSRCPWGRRSVLSKSICAGRLAGVRLVGSRVEGLAVARDRELAAGEDEPVPDHVSRGLSVALGGHGTPRAVELRRWAAQKGRT